MADEPCHEEGSVGTAPLCGLRNSCDLCHSSKLRCSREKPACARCRKSRTLCTYSLTKRPGRPRKAASGVSQGSREDSNAEPIAASLEDMRASGRSNRLPPNQAQQWDVLSTEMNQDGFEQCISILDSLGQQDMLDMDLSNIDSLAMSLIDVSETTNEDPWQTLEPVGEDFNITNQATEVPGSSSQEDTESSSSPSSSDSWLPDSTQFAAECVSLKRWISSSRSLLLFSGAPEQILTDGQCLCNTAVANLYFHSKVASTVMPAAALEACLHLQRLLHWTWTLHKECRNCRDDDSVKFTVAAITNQVVGTYRTIIDDDASGLHGRRVRYATQGNQQVGLRPQTQRLMFDWTVLRFGTKIFHGTAKVTFLRRLVGIKLRQIAGLLADLLKEKSTEQGKELAQPLRLLVSNILEKLNVTAGLLSTLE